MCTKKANVGNAKKSALGPSERDVHVYGLLLMTLLKRFSANGGEKLGEEKPFHTSPPVTEWQILGTNHAVWIFYH